MANKKTSSKVNISLPIVEDGHVVEDGHRGGAELPSDPQIGTIRADPTLIADGWIRRHFVDSDRARESVELYTSLGYEVKVCSPAPEDFEAECAECASIVCRTHVLIYTRKKN